MAIPDWVTNTYVGDTTVKIHFNGPLGSQLSYSQRINKKKTARDAIQTAIQKVIYLLPKTPMIINCAYLLFRWLINMYY
jgi:hypothetical protein